MKTRAPILITLTLSLLLMLAAAACGDDDDTTSTDPVDPVDDNGAAVSDDDQPAPAGTDQPSGDDQPDPSGDDGSSTGMIPETGSWTLTAATVDDTAIVLIDGAPVTLAIEGNMVSGVSACNNYSADLTVDGDQVTFGPVIATEMACDKGDVMDLEASFHEALARVTTMEQDADVLILSGDAVTLTFEPTV